MKYLKIASITLALIMSANAYDVAKHAKELADKAKEKSEFDKWLETDEDGWNINGWHKKDEGKFDKQYWENLRKSEYEKELKIKIEKDKKRGIEIDMELNRLFAKKLAECDVKERFNRVVGAGRVYGETLEEKKEVQKYKRFIWLKCNSAETKLSETYNERNYKAMREYRESKEKEKIK